MLDLKDRISREEARRRLDVSRREMQRLTGDGTLQCIRFGTRYYYYAEQVEALRKEREEADNAK